VNATGEDDMSRGGPERIDLATLDLSAAVALPLRLALVRLVCLPTDTVYGVGGPLSPATVEAIVAVKGREAGKPLQVIFPNRELLLATVPLGRRLTDACLRLLPGPVTLVVPYPADFTCPPPGEVAHDEKRGLGRTRRVAVPTLGLRVPRWPAPARLLETLSFPLVASSANRSGAPAPATLDAVDAGVLAACDLALDGGPAGGMASTVVDLSRYEETGRWRLLREGAWGVAEVEERLTRRRDDLPRI
jgi:tRNA A37 threonylcarbamoyladenosine synthetase subunit TsaC/SUA5/YrdC